MPMTVGKLKKLLNDLPDEMLVVIPSDDHSYSTVVWAAELQIRSEQYGDNLTEHYEEIPLRKGDEVITAVVIG